MQEKREKKIHFIVYAQTTERNPLTMHRKNPDLQVIHKVIHIIHRFINAVMHKNT